MVFESDAILKVSGFVGPLRYEIWSSESENKTRKQ